MFPPELTKFETYSNNPVFTAHGPGNWDQAIRERGWILNEEGVYHMWYTGYGLPDSSPKKLGYATSQDGITWARYPQNPIYSDHWIEDMMVVRAGATYYMFAEGLNDEAQLLTSTDRVHWTRQGKLTIHSHDGAPLSPGPYGTPTGYYEKDAWYLFYERNDEAVWLATSRDLKTWTNVQDEPVLTPGPDTYDREMIALNQIVKHDGYYYAYYHGLKADAEPQEWTTNIAASSDLLHWKKYDGNPILGENKSSGILVMNGDEFRMYTMHPEVCLHLSK